MACRITVRLDTHQAERLAALATRYALTASDVLRWAFRRFSETPPPV